MKKIAALVCLSAGLFCLFPSEAQAQRARWSGYGSNSSYNLDINLTVEDSDGDLNRGFYSQAVKQFSLSRDPEVTQYTNITSLGLGDLIISRPQRTTSDQKITTDIQIIFGDNSPIKSLFLLIEDNDPSSSVTNDSPNVNVNNLSSFLSDLSSINNPLSSKFEINNQASTVYFKDPDGYQTESLNSAEYTIVPEPSFIYSFLLLFFVSLPRIFKQKKFHISFKSTK
ncbi:MAG: hypothetical protein KME52_25575 [Desmonostoc geniculatum HA4340-LM1]|jgi:hypothetical protein|nr:hypothetical protein [Desmonostoc geniculatum HA4340-LM1]